MKTSVKILLSSAELWSRFTSFYVRLAFWHPWILLGIFTLCAVLSVAYTVQTLRVVTDLEVLLPGNASSVMALHQSRERIGSTDFFVIAIRSESKNRRHIADMQDALKTKIEHEWQDASWVQISRETDFFKKHALYYLPDDKLQQLKEIIEDEFAHLVAGILPGFVDLTAKSDDESDDMGERITSWLSSDDLRNLGMPPQIEDAMRELFDSGLRESTENPFDRCPEGADACPDHFRSRLIGPASDVGVVLVQLTSPSTDLSYAEVALKRGNKVIADVRNQLQLPGVEAQVVGAYRSFKEVDSISSDGVTATTVSISLVLGLLFLYFRKVRYVIIIFFPLVFAGAFAMGLTSLIYGRLTVLTIFVLAMLAGMGIDYGVHLLGRIDDELHNGHVLSDSCVHALNQTGAALYVACVTTIASLLVLETGHFEGFREFGIVASIGLLLCFVFTILAVPPLCAVFFSDKHAESLPLSSGKWIYGYWKRSDSSVWHLGVKWYVRHRIAFFILAVGALLVSVLFIHGVSFEHDFRNLRGPESGSTIGYGRAIGKNASTTPSIILGRSTAQMTLVHKWLMARMNDPMVHSFITLRTFVPEMAQQRKCQRVIRQINDLLSEKVLDRLEGRNAAYRNMLRDMSAAEPFGVQQLPQWTQRILREKDGTVGAIGHLYANIKDWDASSVDIFKQRYQQIPVDSGTVDVANSAFIFSDIVNMVKQDGKTFLLYVFGALGLILLIYTRKFVSSLLLLSVITAGGVATMAAMWWLNLKIGLYNIVTVPVILGVGIDCAIHLYHAHMNHPHPELAYTLESSGKLVTVSSWTTICGFTGLLFVSHKGLQTIGKLACIGVGMTWMMTLLILPVLLEYLASRKINR